MARKLNSVVGIDIGSRSIKVAELKSQGKEVVVTALGMAATPEGAVDHTGIYNGDAVAGALKQALQQAGSSVAQAVVSIAGQASVLVRTLEVPRMSPTELKEHMQWEINRNIPFSESTVVSDFKVLTDEDPNSANMDVVMAICPQSAIDGLMSCVKKAGRQLAAIDVEPMGLARSIDASYGEDWKDQTVCLIDIGHKTTSINIYKNGKLLMPRQVPIGGEMFTKAIADKTGVPMSEAEDTKQATDLNGLQPVGSAGTQQFQPYNPFSEEAEAPPEGADPGVTAAITPAAGGGGAASAMEDVLNEFVSEIRRSIDYYKSRGASVDRLSVCGGGAQQKGLSSFLASATGMACDLFDPMKRIQISAKKNSQELLDHHRQEFAVAVGNGLYVFYD
ncbi:MAG TPA: type IV pilus assembly protein PilM [Candidatus Binatia bacterium]|nr:type IV pilus assembly protein PilM [Candidatus Binatia bacterium]